MNHSRRGVRIETQTWTMRSQTHGITPAGECVLKPHFLHDFNVIGITPAGECVLKPFHCLTQLKNWNHSRRGVRIETLIVMDDTL